MDQEALRRGRAAVAVAVVALQSSLALVACDLVKKKPPPEEAPPPPPSAPSRTPQTFDPTPVGQFADADVDGKTPLEQARAYEATGQLWLARLVLEPKALGGDGTKEEAELLGSICARQGDRVCLDKCEKKAGHKLSVDAGPPRVIEAGITHEEPDNDAARARALYQKGDLAGAHKLLEPKVLGDKASKEEIRLLRTICSKEGEQQKMCVALCDAKLK